MTDHRFKIIFGLRVLFDLNNLSVTSLSIVQQTARTISGTFGSMHWAFRDISTNVTAIRNIYAVDKIPKSIVDGHLEYPLADAKPDGAEIEFK